MVSQAPAAVTSVSTIAELTALTVPAAPVVVLGYNSSCDGGGGLFHWMPDDSTPPDGGTVFASSASPTVGRWGSVQRLGVCGGGDMTGRAVSGWGIVDGLGVTAGRNARGRRDAQCRADGARPARQPPRHRRLGAEAARGQAAPDVRPASRRRRASPRSRDAAAGLRELRRAVPHQGLAVSPGRNLVRRGGGTATPVPLSGLRSRRDGD